MTPVDKILKWLDLLGVSHGQARELLLAEGPGERLHLLCHYGIVNAGSWPYLGRRNWRSCRPCEEWSYRYALPMLPGEPDDRPDLRELDAPRYTPNGRPDLREVDE